MKRLLILLFILISLCSFGQTNLTVKNLDVRGTTKLRLSNYIYDTTYFMNNSAGVPFLAPLQPLGWFLTTQKTTGKLVRVTLGQLADTLLPVMPNYWTFVDDVTDTLKNNVSTAGVVAIKGNLELQTTTSTVGQIKQNGQNLIHTYTDNPAWSNYFIGVDAGNFTTTGNFNIAIGDGVLQNDIAGSHNIGIGEGVLSSNETGIMNTSVGSLTMALNVSGWGNTAIGYAALNTNEDGTDNVAIGEGALNVNNAAIGRNTVVGSNALEYNVDGDSNTVIGYMAGDSSLNGHGNIFIGNKAGAREFGNEKLYIDNSNTVTPLIYGDFSTDALTFYGDITYGDTFWDDLSTPATQARIGANNKPTYDYDSLSLKWEAADTATNYVALNFQLPHRWKAGSNIYPHIHYMQKSASDTCEWFIILYKWTDMGESKATAFTRIHTNNQTVYAYVGGSMHQLASFPAISGSGHTESSILDIKLYCWADGIIYMKECDIHFEINKPGSDLEFP